MTPTQQRIVDGFNKFHRLTSTDLVQLGGYRYSARLHELSKMGYEFTWKFKKDLEGRATKTTLYVMRKPGQIMEV